MKALGQIRKSYATIEYCPDDYNGLPISRFAGLDAWCSAVGLWRDVLDNTAPYVAVVGLKENVWDDE